MLDIFSKILNNLKKAAAEDEWLEYEKKEVKELLDEKPQKSGAKSDFGRQQRNIPTESDKTAYDPDFGKPRPKTPSKHVVEVEKGVKPEAATRKVQPAKLQPKPTASQILENIEKKAAEEVWEEEIRKEVKELLDEKPQKPTKPAKSQKLGTTKLAPTKIKPKPSKGIGLGAKSRSFFKSVGKVVAVGAITSVIGFAILNHLGVTIFEQAADEVLQKMGPETDLSDYLPGGANKVIWSEVSYTRHSREDMGDPDSLPNILVDKITIYPPQSGIFVMGISVDDLPDFVSDLNINELGNGNSDWLCEKYGGYFICRSMSKSYPVPLIAGSKSVLTLQYHLPEYELREMLAAGDGTRAIYFIVKY